MVSLHQMQKYRDLLEEEYVSVENPDYEGLDEIDKPRLGGPIIMKAPNGELFGVYANASVRPFVPKINKDDAGIV